MRNSVLEIGHIEQIANDNAAESWYITAKRHQVIAQEAEEASNLEGNINSPDFEAFEQKYGLCCFA